MLAVFKNFFRNLVDCFKGYNLLWQAIAILLTFIFVITNFDIWYFQFISNYDIRKYIFPALSFGGLLPLVVPVILYLKGKTSKDLKLINTSLAVGQAAIIGFLVSAFYKSFTGRIPPIFWNNSMDALDTFRFGFMRGGIFWGWPSSHTTVAFAMSIALLSLYPKNKIIKTVCIFYAAYIGFGVSVHIHWFSEFIAGAIFGTIVGATIGKKFKALS